VEGLFDVRNVSYCCSIIPFIYQPIATSATSRFSWKFRNAPYLGHAGGFSHTAGGGAWSSYQNHNSFTPSNTTEIEMMKSGEAEMNGQQNKRQQQHQQPSQPFTSPIYEPSALHKYSHGMKESKFLFLSPTSSSITVGPTGGYDTASRLTAQSFGLIGEDIPLNHSNHHSRENLSVLSNGSSHGQYASHHHVSHYAPSLYGSDIDMEEEDIDDGLVVKPFTIDFGK
jgi:hypothetical protein